MINWKFWKSKQRPVEPIEEIDGWRLTITTGHGRNIRTYDHPELKILWKIYGWYLTKDSEKYNIKSNQGFDIINRFDIQEMTLRQIKLPKKDWVTGE